MNKTLGAQYDAIYSDAIAAWFSCQTNSDYSVMLYDLLELMEHDLMQPEEKLPSLMQSTVEEIEAEYGFTIEIVPDFKTFLDRIRALYREYTMQP